MADTLRLLLSRISTTVATFAAHPLVQVGVLLACAIWLIVGGSEAALASAMTIGGFILTQMVLNEQRRRENALHLKIDELIVAMKDARNEVVGAEHAADDEIERLRAGLKPSGDASV
jgi:low affinity Fe/Cu permease